MITTRIKSPESLSIGLVELYIGDYVSNINTTTRALEESNYIGAVSSVELTLVREFAELYKNIGDIRFKDCSKVRSLEFFATGSLIEINLKNISLVLGGDGTESGIFSAALETPKYVRVEMVHVYPNKINQLIVIMPRAVVVTKNMKLAFNAENALPVGIEIFSTATDNANWADAPFGDFTFV